MKINIYILLFASIVLEATTCHKQSCETTYEFNIPFSITELDSFRVGDTIWLNSTINGKLLDKNSNNSIDVSNFDFKVYCGMYRMDTTQFDEAEKYFGL